MPLELSYLVCCVIVLLAHIGAEALFGNLQYSARDLLGSREDLPPYGAALGRAKRATQNMIEGMALFAPLILIAHQTGRLNEMTELGAGLFLGARILYAPSYWFAIPFVRSLFWAVGLVGTLIVLFQVLPFTGAA